MPDIDFAKTVELVRQAARQAKALAELHDMMETIAQAPRLHDEVLTSITTLRAEHAALVNEIPKLVARRDALVHEIAELDSKHPRMQDAHAELRRKVGVS